jgi:hypothetical protein
MARYLLHHRQVPDERGVVSASFKRTRQPAFATGAALASCRCRGHEIWSAVDAAGEVR